MGATDQQVDLLVGVGHPLLDVSINVDEKFLARFNLKADDAVHAGPEHNDLIEYCFKNFDNQFSLIAGGATMNSIRTAQWVFNYFEKKQTLFLGSVGEDEYATLLEEQAKKDNVEPLYFKVKKSVLDSNNNMNEKISTSPNNDQDLKTCTKHQPSELNIKSKIDNTKTGICLAFNTNNRQWRSMVTFLGAARQLKATNLDTFMYKISVSSLIYCGGFLLTSSYDAVWRLGQHCKETDKKFALNLSAPFICSRFGDKIAELIPFLDLIFGNEKELREFANYHNFKTDNLQEIALKIFDKFECKNKEQLIVITQNMDDVLCFMRSNRLSLKQYVPRIDKDEIVDTISCGDAFAGGFLAYYLMGNDLDLCLKCGIYCAQQIIKTKGCSLDQIKFNPKDIIDLYNPKAKILQT